MVLSALLWQDLVSRFIYGFVMMMNISYTFLASTATQPWNCGAQSDGTYTMRAGTTQSLWSYVPTLSAFFGSSVCQVLHRHVEQHGLPIRHCNVGEFAASAGRYLSHGG